MEGFYMVHMLSKGEQKGEGSQRQEARVLGCLFTSENLPSQNI